MLCLFPLLEGVVCQSLVCSTTRIDIWTNKGNKVEGSGLLNEVLSQQLEPRTPEARILTVQREVRSLIGSLLCSPSCSVCLRNLPGKSSFSSTPSSNTHKPELQHIFGLTLWMEDGVHGNKSVYCSWTTWPFWGLLKGFPEAHEKVRQNRKTTQGGKWEKLV